MRYQGLIFKLRPILPCPFYLLLRVYYLSDRDFQIKYEKFEFHHIHVGVNQGSVLGIYSYDVYCCKKKTVEVAAFAGDKLLLFQR